MEASALTFTNLEEQLYQFTQDFITTYKNLLLRDGKKATGELISSIKPYSIEVTNQKMEASISLADYWKYVEHGRRPGKFPPINKIQDWCSVKKILPREKNGLKPTEKQLAFLISRKIAEEGIEAGNQFEEALNICWKKWMNNISTAINKDLEIILA